MEKEDDLNFKIVIIGASTGGPSAVEEIIKNIPPGINAALFVVQHMPEFYLDGFVSNMKIVAKMKVIVAQDDDYISPGLLYVVPGASKIFIGSKEVEDLVKPFIEIQGCNEKSIAAPCIDDIMNSAASFFGENVVGVLLSGMGQDGRLGMKTIKRCGGNTIAQDPRTAMIDDMPMSSINDGSAEFILSPPGIAEKIVQLC